MSEERISSTGQFAALRAVDAVASYPPSGQPSSGSASPGTSPRPGTQAVADPPSGAAATPGRPPTAQEIAQAVADANANLASSNRELNYRVDAATGISVAIIRDSQTGVVLQQMPGADIIALARMLAGWAPGKHMLLDLIA